MLRRSFLQTILALGAAPAIVRASSLMPVRVPTQWMRLNLPITCMEMIEHKHMGIKDYERLVYRYTANIKLLIPQFAAISRVWADGEELAFRNGRKILLPGDHLHLRDVDLTPYGNRIPRIEIEVEDGTR